MKRLGIKHWLQTKVWWSYDIARKYMQKTGANLNALTRVAQYMNREKKNG